MTTTSPSPRRSPPGRGALLGAAAALALLAAMPAPALAQGAPGAQDSVFVPLMTYRSGPFAGSGTFIADGMKDYLTMLNERDGGIGGVRINVEECETGYDTKKGVECYEAVKGRNPVVVNPWSTGTTLSLIPRASVDKIPIVSMAYGLSAAGDGTTFPWVFNPPASYWDGATVILKHIGAQMGGMDKLKGKTIGYLYLDAGFGKEPIPLLENLAKSMGFNLKLYPVGATEMQNQSSQWLGVRRDRPDYMVMYGWGAMNGTAVKEAVKVNYPMDKFISIWWPSEDDARGAGEAAKGFQTLNWHGIGTDYPAMKDVQKFVVDAGKSASPKDNVGQVLYARGVYNSVLIAEGIRAAQAVTGKKVVTGEDVRRGLESLNIDAARWAAIGLPGFAGPVQLSCSDHKGNPSLFVQRWDGAKWAKAGEAMEPMNDVAKPLLAAAAKDYAEKNAGWPKRTEGCDRPS